MQNISLIFLTVVMAVPFSTGCSGDGPVDSADFAKPFGVVNSLAEDVPNTVLDSKGHTYIHIGRVNRHPVDQGVLPDIEPVKQKDRDYSELSIQEIAEILRPRLLRDGEEYILAEPDLELAASIKNGSLHPKDGMPFQGSLPTSSTAFEDVEGRIGQAVFPPDGRGYRPNNTSYPDRTFLWSNAERNCSAVLVGPSTAITAAHCVHTGTRWLSPWPKMYPGVDANDSNPYPYGYYQCSDITIPSGWDGSTVSDDYAVVEFGNSRCNQFPGSSLGWLGIKAASDSWLDGRAGYLFGYPGDKTPYPSAWGMGGTVTTSIWYPTRLFYPMDSYHGQSGMGVYTFDANDRYVIGIHHGQYDSDENQARKIDSALIAFIQAYSRL